MTIIIVVGAAYVVWPFFGGFVRGFRAERQGDS
jgi:hypothetical protein